MVGHDGLEPSTTRLKGGCSTAELMAPVLEVGDWKLEVENSNGGDEPECELDAGSWSLSV